MGQSKLATKLVAATLLIVGIVLLIGGTQLALLGGSLYYAAGGIALIISGRWIWQGNKSGYWLYFGFATATLTWAILESGFDLWALLPRLWVPPVLLSPFLLPTIRRDLRFSATEVWASPAMVLAYGVTLLIGANNAQFTPEAASPRPVSTEAQTAHWTHYGASAGGDSYSAADQIDRTNVSQLEPAWTFRTEEDAATRITFQSTPIEIEGDLFFCSPSNRVFSIDGDTGTENWSV